MLRSKMLFLCKVGVIKRRSCRGTFMTFGTHESKVTIPSSTFYKSCFLPQVTARLCVLFSSNIRSLQPWVWCMCVCYSKLCSCPLDIMGGFGWPKRFLAFMLKVDAEREPWLLMVTFQKLILKTPPVTKQTCGVKCGIVLRRSQKSGNPMDTTKHVIKTHNDRGSHHGLSLTDTPTPLSNSKSDRFISKCDF